MAIHRTKLLAAAVLVAGGLAAGTGSGWLATADAQSPPKPAAAVPPAKPAGPKPPAAAQAHADALTRQLYERLAQPAGSKWEYDFVLASEMGTTTFVGFLRDREARGWEFHGEVTLQHDSKAAPHWVFRRASPQARMWDVGDGMSRAFHRHLDAGSCMQCHSGVTPEFHRRMWLDMYGAVPPPSAMQPPPSGGKPAPAAANKVSEEKRALFEKGFLKQVEAAAAATDKEKLLQAEVQRLTDELAALRGKPGRMSVVVPIAGLKSESKELIDALQTLATTRFGKAAGQLDLSADKQYVRIDGDPEAVRWVSDLIEKLRADGVKPSSTPGGLAPGRR